MKNLPGFLCFALLLLPVLCQAQLNGVDLSAVEATTPLSADQLPPFGTFYSASNPQNPPIPSNIFGWNAWFLSNGNYLLDDLDGSSSSHHHPTPAHQIEARPIMARIRYYDAPGSIPPQGDFAEKAQYWLTTYNKYT